MKNFFKNLIQKFREKLELDNPEKYVDGHYQLSKRQKNYWVFGLLILAILFGYVRTLRVLNNSPQFSAQLSIDILVIITLLSSVAILLISYFVTFLLVRASRFSVMLSGRGPIVDDVTKYIIWTVLLFAVMIQITFKIEMPFVGFLLHSFRS